MDSKNYLFLFILIISSQFSYGQIALDTIFISNKRAIEEATKIRYYYYPNLEAYFDTQEAVYICKINGKWVNVFKIPDNYRGYSLKNGIYVIIKGYTGDEPYTLIEQHKKDFPADYSSKPKVKVVTKSN